MSTPININVRSLDWKTEMTSKIMKYHVIGCWLAVIINTLWIIADYYTVPVNWKLFAGIDLAASLTIALAVLLRKHLKIKPKILGLIPMITISLSTAFVYNQIDLESFQKTSFAYATVFIGGGMILLWDVTYSIIVVAISVVANIFLFSKLSPLSIEEFLLNGGILVFSVSIFMIISVQIRYLLVKKDISSTLALKRSQDQLRKLSQAVVQSPVSIMISTLEGEIDYVNPTFEKVTGYTSSEIIGKRGGVLNSTNKNPEEYQSIWNTLSSGNVWKGEFQSKKKNGETIIEDISVTPIKNEMNEVTHYLEIKEDVTAKKQILNKLQESEKKHRVLFDYNPIPMVVFSIQKKAIIEVNQTIIGKYGYSRDEFLNIEQVNTDLYDSIYEISQQKDGDSKDSESAHVLKNGEFVIVEASVTDVDFLGEKVKLISINDISELKYIQMALQDAKQIAEKSRDLQSQFLSNMSHEIRTPMNGILGITRILQKTNVTSEQKHYLKSIYSSANNLMVIINDILDFTKIEAGKLTIEEVPFSLREQIENWYDPLYVKAREKEIDLIVNVDKKIPNNLIGDPIRFNQILINLVENAIKFTEKGKVTINFSLRKKQNKKVLLEVNVIDTGIGIPNNKIEDIFSSFTQASSSTTRKYGGTGLGLTITKQLVELQGGEIFVKSKMGKGSTFGFLINYLVGKQERISVKEDSITKEENIIQSLGRLKVLLVEDHEINQIVVMKVLANWNFKTDLAKNGLEAVEKIQNNNYDIVLMDINMPEMDGYEATKEIRKLSPPKNTVPIIAMTASALKGEDKKCFKMGMNDYISKPFEPENLLKKISNQLLYNQSNNLAS